MTNMSARRQPSNTSLSKFARDLSPAPQARSLDFCNSFWGFGDGGVDVLFARMRGATRTIEELRAFWKERAIIEEDYAKRLAKLAKIALGRDEIGELRNSLDAIKLETERQANFHLGLAQQIRSELEAPTTNFNKRQQQHHKSNQTGIEKEFKNKQIQETYVNKAREKYENDCMRINSYTAQSQLVQGKDLEKITLKLERTQGTVQANQREFANYAKALQDTVQKWEIDWKAFCDSCQDMEEHRLEFMKDILWAYANAVSTVCVSDDESCEKIRVALEQMEPDRDMEHFVREYGTGNQIPDPPAFVNYQAEDSIPSASARPTCRISQFARASTREYPLRQPSMPPEEEPMNFTGVGAGGGSKRTDPYTQEAQDNQTRQPIRSNAQADTQPQQIPHTNGHNVYQQQLSTSPSNPSPMQALAAAQSAVRKQSVRRQSSMASPAQQQQQLHRVLQDPHAETIDPTAETFIKVGNSAYKVDLSKDPQQLGSGPSNRANATSPLKQLSTNGTTVDPLVKQLEELQMAVSTSGSVRRNTISKAKASTEQQKPTHASSSSISNRPAASGGMGPSSLSPPGATPGTPGGANPQNRSPSPGRDYRNSAEVVVGAHPSVSRSTSPNPPTAAFMVPKSTSPAGAENVKDVLADYQQSLPGERKAISRANSMNHGHAPTQSQTSINAPGQQPQQQQQQQQQPPQMNGQVQAQNLTRPPSQLGHAGIGAHGSRSTSPAPISRGPSPAPGQAVRPNSFIQPPAQLGQNMARTPSPNTVGIALDPSGRVLHDELAQRYGQPSPQFQQPPPQMAPQQQQQQMQPPQQRLSQPVYQPPPPPPLQIPQQQQQPQQPQQQSQRRNSFVQPNMTPAPAMVPPPVSAPYGVSPSPVMYQHQHTPSPQPSYIQSTGFSPSPGQYQQPPAQQQPPPQQPQQARYSQQQPVQHQPPQSVQQMSYGSVNSLNGVQRASPGYYGNSTPPQQQQVQQVPPHQQQQQPVQMVAQQQQPRGYQQQQQLQQPPPQQNPYMYRAPSPAHQPVQRSPSPQPPQIADDGNQILFYVKALYDYTATIDEEFDFQAGDIIAVTATPEDGWWSGELLDENRRQKGRNVFPSNFVCLF
ncbi:hypothetical protein D9619_001607 [Psilocybe cf. subviscida]|uniref:SH3 domain-containing protein n=1 Tax=Psilocybe cf. subviscida TaxID=2480587 RepID=A0A8H5BGC6_9AGAR|nr:hypothetical protein D9619_001607 [Psilocybe cf. subviscida]